MPTSPEDDLLRSVAMQNAQSILAARQRAEQEILRAKDELEGKTRELARSLAIMRATLDSTWDGILVTDERGTVTGFNQQLVEMWRIPSVILATRQHHQLVDFFAQQFVDGAGYRSASTRSTPPPPKTASMCSTSMTDESSSGTPGARRRRAQHGARVELS